MDKVLKNGRTETKLSSPTPATFQEPIEPDQENFCIAWRATKSCSSGSDVSCTAVSCTVSRAKGEGSSQGERRAGEEVRGKWQGVMRETNKEIRRPSEERLFAPALRDIL